MKQLLFNSNLQLLQAGWALTRAGIGLTFIFHGYSKLIGGTAHWQVLGSQMPLVGIDFWLPGASWLPWPNSAVAFY